MREGESEEESGDMDAKGMVLATLDDDWSAAAVKKDVDLVAAFYATDAIAHPRVMSAAGHAAAKKIWAACFVDPSFKISWKTLHAEVSASGEIGFTSGTYEDSFIGPDGKLVNETGKYLCVWRKGIDGKWKATHDMWNTDK